jgi:glycine cleavage system H protein
MNIPKELKYTQTHEWARADPDGTVTVGITDHAQEQLGDIVFVEAPKAGRKVAAGEAIGVVESVKAASDIYSPVAGEIVAGNDSLADAPEKVNEDAYGSWIFRVRPDNFAELATLLDAEAYGKIASAD